jgi:DNA-binding CsgD family transcriptional regulator/tetratricopeptide (TPR) repeat protein/energy-coupling factor transporter ATP-binding protein EcfA2
MGDAPDGTQFVGRAGELTRLRAALAGVTAGTGRTIIVGGETGIGKTRLLEQFATVARTDGARVLSGACIEFAGRGLPFAPFVEVLRALVRSVEATRLPALLGPARRGLASLLPELDQRPPGAAVQPETDRGGQARLFELVLDVIERLSQSAPVVLVVEDLQWADDDTRDLLAFLLRHLRSARVMTVLSVRTDGLDDDDRSSPFLAELERDDRVDRIELRPFDRPELRRLLALRADHDPSAELLDDVLTRSGGNPFYAEQLIAMIRSDGGDGAPLPPRLHDVLEARLAGLPSTALEVVRAAAAAGRRVDEDSLAAVLEMPTRVLTDALRTAIDDGILAIVEDAEGSSAYAFRHALLREVAYSQLLPGERIRLHGAFANRLLARGDQGARVEASELAYQLDGARQFRHAVPVLIEAGEVAERAFAYGQAGRRYARALDLWDQSGIDALATGLDRVWAMQRAAECALLSGAHDRAVELGRGAIALLEQAGHADPVRLGVLNERLRWYLWESGDRAAAEAAVAEALRHIPAEPPTAARARALGQAAGLRMDSGDLGAATRLASEAISLARAAGAAAEEALAGGILGWCQAVSGDIDVGTRTYRHALSIAERLGGVEGIALGHSNLAALLDRVGRTGASLEVALDGYAIVRRLGVSRTYGGVLLGHAAKALFDLGRWTEATAKADEGLALDPLGRGALELHLARARIDTGQGRYDEASEHLDRARDLAESTGLTGAFGPSILAGEADLAQRQGRLVDVRAAVDSGFAFVADGRPLDPALGWLAETGLRAEADAAGIARARRDAAGVAGATARATEISAVVKRASMVPAIALDARLDAMLALCSAERRRLDGPGDGSEWEEVATHWDTLQRPHPAAYARFRQAEAMLGSHGSRIRAVATLRAAHQVAAALGADPLRSEIELLARYARIDLPDPVEPKAKSPPAVTEAADELGLTERESEVIRLVAAGWSNQQIADALFITRKTASVHVSNILGKFGVSNRVEAAAIAHRIGLG